MQRREFIRNGFGTAAAVTASLVLPRTSAFAAPTVIFSDSFQRASTKRGWGGRWFNQRAGLSWGVDQNKGFVGMPKQQLGAAPFNPNPVLVLNKDVTNVTLRSTMIAGNTGSRFGLVARAVSYGEYYAAYVERDHLVIARFNEQRDAELARVSFRVGSGVPYWVKFNVSGVTPVSLKFKVWKVGKREPSAWSVVAKDTTPKEITRAGMFGYLFMHDAYNDKPSKVRVAKFKASSPDTPRQTRPKITYAFAGRTQQEGTLFRSRIVAKTDVPAAIKFQVSTDPTFKLRTSVAPDVTLPKIQAAKAWFTGLPAATTVYWRVVAETAAGGKAVGDMHTFRTPPLAGQEATFAFGSCTRVAPVSRSFGTAAALEPLFFAHLGDFGYAQHDTGGASAFVSRGSYQDRWMRMLTRPTLNRLMEKSSWIMIQDDHDYGSNNCWSATVRPFTVGAWNDVSGNLDKRYFDMRYGDVHAFVTDTHRYADDPDAPDGPDHSLLGDTQKTWLKAAMQASDAPLLVVFSSMPLWGSGMGSTSWRKAFATERKELVRFFCSLQGPGRRVLVCSGNSHSQLINVHKDPDGRKDLVEFVSSGTDRRSAAGARPMGVDDGVIDPTRSVKDADGFGFVRLEAAGGNRRVVIRSVASDTGLDVWAPLSLAL